MLPRKGGGRRGGSRGAAEPGAQIDRIERILAGFVQVVQDAHSNTANTTEQLAAQAPRAEAVVHTTIRQFQQLKPSIFQGTPDPMAAESWILGIERVFEVLPCTDE